MSCRIRVVALRQPVGAAFFCHPEVGLHPELRTPLQVVPAVLAQDALQRLAECLHAERVAVAAGLHVGQTGVIEVATGLQGPDAGAPHEQAVRLGGREQLRRRSIAEHRRQGNRGVAGRGGVLRLTLAVAVQVMVGGSHQRQRRVFFTDEAGQGKKLGANAG